MSIENRLGGDSNVVRQEDKRKLPHPRNDGTFDLVPRIAFHDENDDLPYSFDYQPTYRKFMTYSGLDGVDHLANGRVGWMLSSKNRIDLTGAHFNGRQFVFGSKGTGTTLSSVNARKRIRISDGTLGYRRNISSRSSIRLQGSINDFDASGNSPTSLVDSRAYSGRVSADYGLNPLTEIGLSTSGRLRENRAIGSFRPSSRTEVWDVMASITRKITPTLTVAVQAGPSIIRQQQFSGGARNPNSPSCVPGNFKATCDRYEKAETSTVTGFASASLSKEWKTGGLNLSYVRSESRSGTVNSGSAINNELEIVGNRRITDRIVLRASGAWTSLAQIAKQQVQASRFEVDVYSATGTAEFVLSRRVMLIGQYTFVHQDSSASQSISSKIDIHSGFVGLRYTFEPLAY
ncbi:hypothetical protein K2X89_00010 [Myxococcota bacterium]|nr:hypothetical protein [Myxococcota bacterium]